MTLPSKVLLAAMEADLPRVARPFRQLAARFGVSESELLKVLRAGIADGRLRRYGARVRHRLVGYVANVMVVWRIAAEDVDRAALALAAHPAVSHCYERPPFPAFPYNLYTMVHGRSREECEGVISELSARSGCADYVALWTLREFKKSTPDYGRLTGDVPNRNTE